MNINRSLLLIGIFICQIGYSQDIQLSGRFYNPEAQEYVANVVLVNLENNQSTLSDIQGSFNIPAIAGRNEFIISTFSYRDTMVIYLKASIDTLLYINPVLDLDPVVVSDSKPMVDHAIASVILSNDFLSHVPSTFENDILKSIQLLPGVTNTNEGTAGLSVRGGSPDQNLILLNDVPIYNVSHIFGFISVFNTALIDKVDVIKGGFPAKYDGRLSSIINVETKKAKDKRELEMSIGLLQSKLFLSGKFNNKLSGTISLRRSIYEAVYGLNRYFQRNRPVKSLSNYVMGDAYGEINYDPTDKDLMTLYFFTSGDKIYKEELSTFDSNYLYNNNYDKVRWGNTIISMDWRHVNKSSILKTQVYYNKYQFNINSINENKLNQDSVKEQRSYFDYSSGVEDFGIKFLHNISLGNQNVEYGAKVIWHNYTPGEIVDNAAIHISNRISALEMRGFLSSKISVRDKTLVTAGVNVSKYRLSANQQFSSFEPRLALIRSIGPLKVYAHYSIMQQYIHLLANSGLGIPTDLWIPSTRLIGPQRSQQFGLGINGISEWFNYSLEAYYKQLRGLVDYKDGASFLINDDFEQNVEVNGAGTAKGIELLLSRTVGKWSSILSYTLSSSNRVFANLNNGKSFPYVYSNLHSFSTTLEYKRSDKFHLSLSWVFQSGRPINLPSGIYPSPNYPPQPNSFISLGRVYNPILDIFWPSGAHPDVRQPTEIFKYDGRNQAKLPNYHRLDIGAKFIKETDKRIRTWDVSIYNVYNRVNPYYVTYYFGGSSRDPLNATGNYQIVSLFQIIPSISYTLKFK